MSAAARDGRGPEAGIRARELRAADGTALHLAEFGAADAERAIVIVHGYAEHGGRYMERARTFVEAGYRVLVPDVRGHGRSGGPRGHVMEFGTYLDDLAVVLHEVGDAELFLLGHSHGGLIVARWLLERARPVSRAALSSPFFGVGMNPPAWKLAAARLLSRWLPRVSLPSEIDPRHVCHDPEVVARYESDPLNHKVNNARWFIEATAAQERSFAEAGRLSTPTLIMQAGDDRIVAPSATRRFADLAPKDRVVLEVVDGAFHELLFEPEGQQHAERILRWFDTGR